MSHNCNGPSDKSDLSFDANMENSSLEKLRMENVELCELLKEYQTALELIMSRYRSDMSGFMQSGSVDRGDGGGGVDSGDFDALRSMELDLTVRYVELYQVAVEASADAEAHVERLEKSVETLHAENEAMRDVLGLLDDRCRSFCYDAATATGTWGGALAAAVATETAIDIGGGRARCGTDDSRKSSDHLFDSSFSDDDRCSVSSDASVKTLI